MNNPPGTSYQFTPFGLTALGDASNAQPGEYAASAPPVFGAPAQSTAVVAEERSEDAPRKAQPPPVRQTVSARQTAPLKPSDVLKLARARVREIKAELKRHEALKKELLRLENMLSAAKPLAPVRALDSARRAG